ncbi:MAG TPA: helix-turn-helix domain-containing protein [Pyrinomonadaceae bacterium]
MIEGDWVSVEPVEARDLLAQAIDALSLTHGDWVTQFVAVRKLPLSFYPENSFLVEALAHLNNDSSGYLTFVHHPSGLSILDGTSPAIHELNHRLPLVLNEAQKASDYLRFLCAAVGAEHGTFMIVEKPKQIPWAENVDEEIKVPVEKVIEEIEFLGTNETTEGTTWRFDANVVYSDSVYRASFNVMNSGMIDMLQDQPLFAELNLLASSFAVGLRTLHPALKQEPVTEDQRVLDNRVEKAISVLRLLGEASGDFLLTLGQARVLMDIFANPGTTPLASETRLAIESPLISSAIEVLVSKKMIELKPVNADGQSFEMYINSVVEPTLQEVVTIFPPDTSNVELFLGSFESALIKLPVNERTLAAALITSQIYRRSQDRDEIIDSVAFLDPDHVIEVFEKLVQVGVIGQTPG